MSTRAAKWNPLYHRESAEGPSIYLHLALMNLMNLISLMSLITMVTMGW